MTGKNAIRSRNAGKPLDDHAVPMALPSRALPTHQTLVDIASERHPQLKNSFSADANGISPSIITRTINPDGSLSDAPAADEPIGLLGQSVVYALTFSMLFFTFDTLVFHQYRQDIDWTAIWKRTMLAFPILLFIMYMVHPRADSLWMQTLLMVLSSAAGCYLVYSSNREPYFAVMTRAPPLGTLWIWSVLEMKLPFALVGVLAVGFYFWLGGFTLLG